MIALMLAALLAQAEPAAHSAACLQEVAAMTDDRLQDQNSRTAATLKADRLRQLSQEVLAGVAAMDALALSYDEARHRKYLADRSEVTAPLVELSQRAPSCAWPAIPPAVER